MLVMLYFTSPTPYSVPSEPPENVQGWALSSTALRVSWDPPPSEAQHGTLRGYKVRYAEADDDTDVDDAAETIAGSDDDHVDIRDLLIWTQYKIWVAPFTQVGDGPFSDLIIVQTDEDGRFSHDCGMPAWTLVVDKKTNTVLG